MKLFSGLSQAYDVKRSPHASYLLLLLLTIFIAASDFLTLLSFEFDARQLLHIAAVALPLIFWGLSLKLPQPFIQNLIPSVVFLALFSIWSGQLYMGADIRLVFIAGLMLLVIWHGVQGLYRFLLGVLASIVMLVLLQLFTELTPRIFTVYTLLLISSLTITWFALTYRQGSVQPVQSLAESDFLPESVPYQNEAELAPVSDLEADIAMVNVETDQGPKWEYVLRELHKELKNTADTDKLFKRMLVFMSGAIEIEAAAVGMIQERSLNRITQYGPDDLVHSKVLAWNNERIRTLIQTQQATVNQQEHMRDGANPVRLYRLDIPVISNDKTVGIVTIFRTSLLFDEYEVSLASSIVFHSMVALRQARLQEEVKRLSSSAGKKTLYTREQFIERARKELDAINKPRSLSLLIIEIDNMNEVNSKHGHEAASKLYKTVASSIMGNLDVNDVLGSYGKDGFIVMLHEADLLSAKKIGEQMRSRASQLQCKVSDMILSTTLSIGLTTVSEQSEDMASLIRKADMGLFVAKESGRNSVKVSL